jgi:uncharacterized protein (TIGR02246 family)
MAREKPKSNDEGQIRLLIDNWAKALRAKDVDGIMASYAPDVTSFDLAPPLQYLGTNAYRKSLEQWLPSFAGPVGYEVHDLNIAAGDGAAFCHSLNRITGTRTNGEKTDVWVRATVCLAKIDGAWKVTHEHVSVPFYMDGSYKAAVDLQP